MKALKALEIKVLESQGRLIITIPEISIDLAPNKPARRYSRLTGKQRAVYKLLLQGKLQKEAASILGIGLSTVKKHCVAIRRKKSIGAGARLAPNARSMPYSVFAKMAAEGYCRKEMCKATGLSWQGVNYRLSRIYRLNGLYGHGDRAKFISLAARGKLKIPETAAAVSRN
jgi:DNA-binding CsgD family transcriptional regulator